MKVVITVIIIIQAVLYTLETVKILRASAFEDEIRWRLRSLTSLGVIIVLAITRMSL